MATNFEKYSLRDRVYYKNVREVIEDVYEKLGQATAFSYRKSPSDKEVCKVSYARFCNDVRALATELCARSLARKNCVVIGALSYNWICTYFALLSIGSVLVPLDREWSLADLEDSAKKADVAAIICDHDLVASLSPLCTELGLSLPISLSDKEDKESIKDLISSGKARMFGGDDSYYKQDIDSNKLSLLVFTSGTTGKGKGVMLTQSGILSNVKNVIPYVDLGKKTIAILPPHHTYGSTAGILGMVCAGCEIYISSGVRHVAKEMKEQQPEHLILVPLYLETFYRKILSTIKEKGKDKSFAAAKRFSQIIKLLGIDARERIFASVRESFGGKLRTVVSGGAPLSPEILDFFECLGISVLNGYGITECSPIISVNYSKIKTRGSVGQVIDEDEVIIADPNENGEGEIRVKGPNVMLGYYKNERASAEAFDENGYFRTGDYGKFGKDGALFITGRLKNLIILSNGKNVYPEEIETELSALPGLLEIVVYEGKSNRGRMHDAVVAEIYPDKEYFKANSIEDIRAYFAEKVNAYNKTAVPYKKIGIVKLREDEFPKNTLRKIMRFKLDTTIE